MRFFMAMFLLILAGCGSGLVDVEGRITLDEQPLPDATVVFTSDDRPMAVGQTDAEGQYQLRTGQQQGVAPGDYRVTVSAYRTVPTADGNDEPVPEFLTPPRYNNAETSGLTAEVGGDQDEFNFALSSAEQ